MEPSGSQLVVWSLWTISTSLPHHEVTKTDIYSTALADIYFFKLKLLKFIEFFFFFLKWCCPRICEPLRTAPLTTLGSWATSWDWYLNDSIFYYRCSRACEEQLQGTNLLDTLLWVKPVVWKFSTEPFSQAKENKWEFWDEKQSRCAWLAPPTGETFTAVPVKTSRVVSSELVTPPPGPRTNRFLQREKNKTYVLLLACYMVRNTAVPLEVHVFWAKVQKVAALS